MPLLVCLVVGPGLLVGGGESLAQEYRAAAKKRNTLIGTGQFLGRLFRKTGEVALRDEDVLVLVQQDRVRISTEEALSLSVSTTEYLPVSKAAEHEFQGCRFAPRGSTQGFGSGVRLCIDRSVKQRLEVQLGMLDDVDKISMRSCGHGSNRPWLEAWSIVLSCKGGQSCLKTTSDTQQFQRPMIRDHVTDTYARETAAADELSEYALCFNTKVDARQARKAITHARTLVRPLEVPADEPAAEPKPAEAAAGP